MGYLRAATLILIGISFQSSLCHSLTQEQAELIDQIVALLQTENFIPGLLLSVVENGEIVISKGYGKRDLDNDLDVDENTLFAIGSISKSMTSLLVVKVLSEKFPDLGETVMDLPISKFEETLNFTLSDRFRTESSSFRDLLSHRTCIYNDGSILLFEAASLEELVYRTRYDTEICSDRASFVYNNAIYSLAGDLIGRIAGSSYPKLMAELFLELGMTSSHVVDAEGSHEDLPNMSRAYTRLGQQVLEFDRTHLRRLHLAGGAGAVLSTASDMSKYVQFHLNGGQVGGVQIVPMEVLYWMREVSIPTLGFDFLSTTGSYGYGLGIGLSFFNGKPWITHSGYWPPYESMFSLFPEPNATANIGIFSSINGPGTTGTDSDIISQQLMHIIIMQILKGEIGGPEALSKIRLIELKSTSDDLFPISAKKHTAKSKPKKIIGSSLKMRQEEYAGLYGNPNHGDLTITLNSELQSLEINYGKWGIGKLLAQPPTANAFDVEWTTTLNYDFYSYGPNEPIPVFEVVFDVDAQYLDLVSYRISFRYHRDATLNTFPEIPWSPESCGP